ncbi:MAG TPA: hypothetical protein VMM18_06820 [Gemmatimonadaceae bacterium]|nr:hypothetical protein [Gemmatimonadaceae bacterium]
MILHFVFLASFLSGLLALVMFMLFGVERHGGVSAAALQRGDPDAWRRLLGATSDVRARVGLPGLAAFATLFGAVGYALSRYTTVPLTARLVLAALAGGAALALAITLVAKWAVPSARKEVIDERFLLQGHFATVTVPVAENGTGEVAYEVGGVRFTALARSLDGVAIGRGADVVIERVEDGCAHIEPWVQVEKRL